MVLFLKERERFKEEKMDDPNCDKVMLDNTYRQFVTVNRILSGWRRIYLRYFKPRMSVGQHYSVLDIGAGAGDIPLALIAWAKADGFQLSITAIDPDPRAFDYMQSLELPASISSKCCSTFDLIETGKRFDFVISNSVLHHIPEAELCDFLESSQKLADALVLHNDIVRDDLAYVLFTVISKLIFHNSFVSEDGSLSIRRSFIKSELKEYLPKDWRIDSLFPYRHLLIHETGARYVA